MFAYFWNSEAHLGSLVFWTELIGSLIEIAVVASYLFTFAKEPTEEVRTQREHRAEVFGLLAAIIVLTVVLGNRRIGVLAGIEAGKLGNRVEVALSQNDARSIEQLGATMRLQQFSNTVATIIHGTGNDSAN